MFLVSGLLGVFLTIYSRLVEFLPYSGNAFHCNSAAAEFLGALALIIYAAVLLAYFAIYFLILHSRANDISNTYATFLTLIAAFPLCAIALGFVPGSREVNSCGPPPLRGVSLRRR